MRHIDAQGRSTVWHAYEQAWNFHFSWPDQPYMRVLALNIRFLRSERGPTLVDHALMPPFHPRTWASMTIRQEWTWTQTWPALVRREFGYLPRSRDDFRARCQAWLRRARAAHAAAPARVDALLVAAAVLLPRRLADNRDVLDRVLRLALPALCTEHLLDRKRRPLRMIL